MLLSSLILIAMMQLDDVQARRRGHCELPTEPSPRTAGCSVKQDKEQTWIAFQKQLAAEAAAYQRSSQSDDEKPPLLLLGDSITEALRGTAIGLSVSRTNGIETVLPTAFPGWRRPVVLAISADETQHMLWRLSRKGGGELTREMANDARLAISLLIGTNNLGNAHHSPEEAAAGVVAVAHELLQRTKARLLLNAILPRSTKIASTAPDWRKAQFKSLMPAVNRMNDLINQSVRIRLATQFPGRIRFVDCGSSIFLPQRDEPQSWGTSASGLVGGKCEVRSSDNRTLRRSPSVVSRLWGSRPDGVHVPMCDVCDGAGEHKPHARCTASQYSWHPLVDVVSEQRTGTVAQSADLDHAVIMAPRRGVICREIHVARLGEIVLA